MCFLPIDEQVQGLRTTEDPQPQQFEPRDSEAKPKEGSALSLREAYLEWSSWPYRSSFGRFQ